MKKIFLSLLALSSSLFAQDCTSCEPSCLSFGGEWLYFMPSFDQSEFLWDGAGDVPANADAIADRIGEKQRYYSAFRVEASYLALTFRYTNFHENYFTKIFTNRGSQILGLPINELLGDIAGSVAFDRDYSYYNIEGLFSFYKTAFYNFCPTFSTGIRFVHLHIKENANYSDNTNNQFVEPDMRAWALGPCIEFDALYGLTSCFELTGRFLLGVLADQNRSKSTVSQGANRVLIKNTPQYWHVTRSTNGRLGISFSKKRFIPCYFTSLGLFVEGGYEMINERRFLSRIYNVNNTTAFSFNEWSDFTLNGPYLRINLKY